MTEQDDSHRMNERGCYCGIWDTNPAFFESQGVPKGYCGFCRTCEQPGHVRHFPGAAPFTACWCDRHYRRISIVHPLGSIGILLYYGLPVLGLLILWLVS